jgi:catalase
LTVSTSPDRRINVFEGFYRAAKKQSANNLFSDIAEASYEVEFRHIGNCLKTDPAYSKGVADALGIPLSKIRKS